MHCGIAFSSQENVKSFRFLNTHSRHFKWSFPQRAIKLTKGFPLSIFTFVNKQTNKKANLYMCVRKNEIRMNTNLIYIHLQSLYKYI